jgi:conjugative relaxase-like TrwC/TraI family protein
MLSINQQRSASGAAKYFDEGLAKEDYYTKDSILGRWGGKGAERLGLVGEVQRDAFIKLCDNRDPNTGEQLTARTRADRTVGYDLTFQAPKSVSLLYTLTKDQRILDAFQSAVRDTMQELEGDMRTRVRQGGQNAERITGNFVYAEFVHLTARPVDGVPDPHLHAHCFTFNATFDSEESRWKAGQFREVKRDAPYFEAAFDARFSKRIADLGLTVERTKTWWDVAGIGKPVLDKFSRRTAIIEKRAKELADKLAKENKVVGSELKAQLGAMTRERKGEPRSLDALRAEWKGRLTEEERAAVKDVLSRRQTPKERPVTAHEAVDHAIGHSFERFSVVEERRVLAMALKRGYGSVLPEDAKRDFGRRSEVIRKRFDERNFVTTREVLAEEAAVVSFARDGRGTCKPFERNVDRLAPKELNRDQTDTVRHVLTSTDQVMLIRGAAGTGKTTLLKAAADEIRARGGDVHVFAPTTEAARDVLRKEGFPEAETVARLLKDPKAQEKVRGQVIWVDEAGLVGTKDLRSLFRVAKDQDARVVLMGDSRQHSSIPRGDAFRLLQTHAGIIPAEVRDIRRQQGEYRKAVEALASGDLETGFTRLDQMGAIREVAGPERHELLASGYTAAIRQGKSALVVAPTHAEGREVTARIRDDLKTAGTLRGKERVFSQLISYGMTEAERKDPVRYQQGDVVRFHQNAKGGFGKGEAVQVIGNDSKGQVLVMREKNRSEMVLPLDAAKRFDVYERKELPLAVGDRIRVTQNGTTADGKGKLINGSLHSVASFGHRGNIVLDNGQVISKDYGHLAHGYCATSHASQGKTVDRVFVAMGPESFAASKEQFYVSVSRARESISVYCEDKRELLESVSRSSSRMSATELTEVSKPEPAASPSRLVRIVEHIRRVARATFVRDRAERRDIGKGRDTVGDRDRVARIER